MVADAFLVQSPGWADAPNSHPGAITLGFGNLMGAQVGIDNSLIGQAATPGSNEIRVFADGNVAIYYLRSPASSVKCRWTCAR